MQQALAEIAKIADTKERRLLLRARVPKCGIVGLGITGSCTALIGAMMVSRFAIVSSLLEHGADPYECDAAGNDPLMFAAIFGRTDNVKFWLKRYPDWNLERKNSFVGAVVLALAVCMGPHRL